jgi:hypothetical protein
MGVKGGVRQDRERRISRSTCRRERGSGLCHRQSTCRRGREASAYATDIVLAVVRGFGLRHRQSARVLEGRSGGVQLGVRCRKRTEHARCRSTGAFSGSWGRRVSLLLVSLDDPLGGRGGARCGPLDGPFDHRVEVFKFTR